MEDEKFQTLHELIEQRDRSTSDAWAAWDLIDELVTEVYGTTLNEVLNAYEKAA